MEETYCLNTKWRVNWLLTKAKNYSLLLVSSRADVLILRLLNAGEVANRGHIDSFVILFPDLASCVIGVFRLHANEGSLVDVHASFALLAPRDAHVQIE